MTYVRPASLPLAFATLLAVSFVARAQSLDRSKRPIATTDSPFKFPAIKSHVLPNGLRLLTVEDHSLPVVAVRAVVRADETLDPPGKEGLYAVTFGLLRDGTTRRTFEQLGTASSKIGTAVSPTAFSTVSEYFSPALELMGEMLMHPLFDPAALERRKASQAANARASGERPFTPARRLFYSLLNGRDAASTRALYATDAGAGAITRDDVLHFYEEFIHPRVTTIVVVGDVSEARVLAEVARVFGGWRTSEVAPRAQPPMTPSQRPTTIYLHDVPGPAAYIYVGNAGPPRSSPDLYAAEMMGTVAANRFVQRLREKRSFMYSGTVGMIWRRVPTPSDFMGSTNVNATKVDSALVEWLDMLRELRSDAPPTVGELDAAKRARVGPLAVRIDGSDSIATRLAEIARDSLPQDYFERYAKGVSAVSVADVAASIAKYVDVGKLVIVVTGDRSVLEPVLRGAKIAPVVVVDANGVPVP